MLKKENIKLRPHHVLSYIAHIISEEDGENIFYLPDKEYIELIFRRRGATHSDETLVYFRDTLKKLYENPDMKFEYARGIEDSVCTECENKKKCADPEHEYCKTAEAFDKAVVEKFPELEFGQPYKAKLEKNISYFLPCKIEKMHEISCNEGKSVSLSIHSSDSTEKSHTNERNNEYGTHFLRQFMPRVRKIIDAMEELNSTSSLKL